VLHADHVSRNHGGQTVLDDVSLTVGPESRIGSSGDGIGKSTLLRILAGLEEPDAGVVRRSPASTTVGWLPQEPDAHAGEVLRAYLARRTGVAAAEAELERLTAAMADDASSSRPTATRSSASSPSEGTTSRPGP
jgi:ATPase subunit of ABC transporter with duplicated ATPase domains